MNTYRPNIIQNDSLKEDGLMSLALRVVMITPYISVDAVNDNGAGVAFFALAQQMVTWGLDVSVAYIPEKNNKKIKLFQRRHYQASGIKFIPLDEAVFAKEEVVESVEVRGIAWQVYRWLERHESDYDLAIFLDSGGLAYYALLAKGQGLAFKNLTIVVNTHGPKMWVIEGNRELPDSLDVIDLDFMERESVRRADWVISPSHYMFEWMRQNKWQINERHDVIQSLTLGSENKEQQKSDFVFQKPSIIVFFGALNINNGLKLFCDAVDRLPDSTKAGIKSIHFLGKNTINQNGLNSINYIKKRSTVWNIQTKIIVDKSIDEALEELAKPSILAVLPALAENSLYMALGCLQRGIHFIAPKLGGIPELVDAEDAKSCLFLPTPASLAQCLNQLVVQGGRAASMAVSQHETMQKWQNWLTKIETSRAIKRAPAIQDQPLVSVCLVHYNRPHYLAKALDSIRQQTYQAIELILVDDGSYLPEATKFLDELEPEFKKRGWRIIRQENSYLGMARNRAAEAAQGQYLLFMDDDNTALSSEIETFVSAMQHVNADVLTCVLFCFTETKQTPVPRVWVPLGGASGPGLYRNVYGDANAFWKREAFMKSGGYTTDYGVGFEDWELFTKAVLSGLKLELVPRPLFNYLISKNGMLRSGDELANFARSTRAYLHRDVFGHGAAYAYAVFLQNKYETLVRRLRIFKIFTYLLKIIKNKAY